MRRTRNIALFLVSLVLPAAYCQTTDPCVPDCTNVKPGEMVPDPFDCTRYYVCSSEGTPSDTSLPCPENVFFNPASNMCDGTECIQICGKCHLTCTGAGDIVANPFDCSGYYECSIAGPGDLQTCKTPLPYFDSSNQKCSDNSSVCCRPGCNPYCEPNFSGTVPDPTDCTKYYLCTASPPYPHFSCAPGQVFNYGTGFCEDGGECKILCSDVVDPGSTSTPVNPDSTTVPANPVSTTTVTTPIITSKTTTTKEVCVTTFVCPGNGFFAKCSICDPRYFYCSEAGALGIEQVCTGGLLFNPIPEFPYCIRPEDCPYTPPFN